MSNQQLDDYLVQQIISRFILPFDRWPAYKLGIIDAEGRVLKKRSQLRTSAERAAWGYLDILCCNLRKILYSYPTTRLRMAQLNMIQNAPYPTTIGQPPTIPLSTLAGTFFLLKDWVEYPEDINYVREKFEKYLDEVFHNKINMDEDAPVNGVGGGNIAAVGIGPQGDPPKRSVLGMLRRRKALNVEHD